MNSDQNVPLITIGMTCYNSEDTIERAIDSALAQDWTNFEVVIVDDGSKDSTPKVVRNKIKDIPNARFIQHETNKKFPGALNTIIKNAKGEFIAIFDDDDESTPNRLSVQYRTITDYEWQAGVTLIACYGSGIRRYPNGYEVKFQAIGSRPNPPVGMETADYLMFYGKKEGVFYGSGTPSCSLMTRKTTYEVAGLYDETMTRSEDSDFSTRLGLKGGHFIGCPEEVIIQYATGGEDKRPEVTYNGYRFLMEKYKDYLVSCGRYDYAMLWNKLRLYHFGQRRLKTLGILFILFVKHPILTWSHFWSTAPRRIIHEWNMNRKAGRSV